jgi:hypothetical protein
MKGEANLRHRLSGAALCSLTSLLCLMILAGTAAAAAGARPGVDDDPPALIVGPDDPDARGPGSAPSPPLEGSGRKRQLDALILLSLLEAAPEAIAHEQLGPLYPRLLPEPRARTYVNLRSGRWLGGNNLAREDLIAEFRRTEVPRLLEGVTELPLRIRLASRIRLGDYDRAGQRLAIDGWWGGHSLPIARQLPVQLLSYYRLPDHLPVDETTARALYDAVAEGDMAGQHRGDRITYFISDLRITRAEPVRPALSGGAEARPLPQIRLHVRLERQFVANWPRGGEVLLDLGRGAQWEWLRYAEDPSLTAGAEGPYRGYADHLAVLLAELGELRSQKVSASDADTPSLLEAFYFPMLRPQARDDAEPWSALRWRPPPRAGFLPFPLEALSERDLEAYERLLATAAAGGYEAPTFVAGTPCTRSRRYGYLPGNQAVVIDGGAPLERLRREVCASFAGGRLTPMHGMVFEAPVEEVAPGPQRRRFVVRIGAPVRVRPSTGPVEDPLAFLDAGAITPDELRASRDSSGAAGQAESGKRERSAFFAALGLAGLELGMSREAAQSALRAHFGGEARMAPLTFEGSAGLGRVVTQHWAGDLARVSLAPDQRWPGIVARLTLEGRVESVIALLGDDGEKIVGIGHQLEYPAGTVMLDDVLQRFRQRYVPDDEFPRRRGGWYYATERQAPEGSRCLLPQFGASFYGDGSAESMLPVPVANSDTVSTWPVADCGRTVALFPMGGRAMRFALWLFSSAFAERHASRPLAGEGTGSPGADLSF